MLKLGNTSIGSVFFGSTEIGQIYLGSQLIFQKNSEGDDSSYDGPATTKDGSLANPFIWDEIVDTNYSNRCHSQSIDTANLSQYRAHIYVKLQAGTTYTLGVHHSDDGYLYLFDKSGNVLVSNDDDSGSIDGVPVWSIATYTPSTTDWYILCLASYGDYYSGTASGHIYPAPLASGEAGGGGG